MPNQNNLVTSGAIEGVAHYVSGKVKDGTEFRSPLIKLSPHRVVFETFHAPAEFRTSLVLTLAHRSGALAEVLTLLSQRGVNLAKLESRPIPSSPWKYRFYLDVEGNAARDPVRGALEEIRPHTTELRVLGSYPAAAREA